MLPPLSGYTDYPYRQILAKFKPPFITTEMVNARAVVEGNQRTIQMLKKVTGSHFNGAQLLGKDPNFMAKAAKIIEDRGFDYVDINMGCTVRKVISKGEGVSLMKDEVLACKIVKTVSNAVDIPVTVKLRTGFCQQSINVISLSQKLACSGAAAITIHGRTGEKKFQGLMLKTYCFKQGQLQPCREEEFSGILGLFQKSCVIFLTIFSLFQRFKKKKTYVLSISIMFVNFMGKNLGFSKCAE